MRKVRILSARIEELKKDLSEEGQELSQNSLSSFLSFCELIDEFILVDIKIGVNPSDNEIYATYKTEHKKHCMSFKADGTIKYFVMCLEEIA